MTHKPGDVVYLVGDQKRRQFTVLAVWRAMEIGDVVVSDTPVVLLCGQDYSDMPTPKSWRDDDRGGWWVRAFQASYEAPPPPPLAQPTWIETWCAEHPTLTVAAWLTLACCAAAVAVAALS